jgi:hypothetical protein
MRLTKVRDEGTTAPLPNLFRRQRPKARRSSIRPGSEPGLRVLAGVAIEGLEDLADIADGAVG